MQPSRLVVEDAIGWARGVTENPEALVLRADDIPLDVIAELGGAVVKAVGEKRSTWRRCKLMAGASRQLMGRGSRPCRTARRSSG